MSGYGMQVWNKYTRKLGSRSCPSGDFDPDSGTSHAVEFGRTLCGVDVGRARDGWEQNLYARGRVDAAFVICRRCRRSLEKAEAQQ